MARIIDLEFKDKKYSIEYNRESIVRLFSMEKEEDNTIENAIALVECGLMKNHKDDMPDRETIVSWLLSMGDELPEFVKALQECIQAVIELIQDDQKSKNFKWGVRR